MKVGDLVTPTGRLVVPADRLGGDEWLLARRWRDPIDMDPNRIVTQEDWEDPRGYRIGASDAPSILDLDGVDTPAHVYREKVYDIRKPVNEAMQWGHIFEAPIALEWCRRNRAVIDEIGLVAKDGMPWLQATIDRRVRECPVFRDRGEDVSCGLEVKHCEFVSPSRWHTENGIPDRITVQIIVQLAVTGYHHIHYACKVPGGMRQGIIYRDREQELTDYVIGELTKFRSEHLLTGVEPDWSEAKPDKMIVLDNATNPERSGVVEIDVEAIGDVQAYAQAAADESAAKTRKKKLAARLRQLADGAEIVKFSGERAYWYGEGGRSDTDLEQLKERWPDAYEACVTESRWPVLHIDKAYKPRGERA